MTKLVIERFRTQVAPDKQTLGTLFVIDSKNKVTYKCFTLELPNLNNKQKVSCIPTGEYTVVKRNSPKYGDHFHILDVPNRSFILIHQGNYHTQIEGCVLVGKDLVDINKDGILDVTSSVNTMKDLYGVLPDKFTLALI